MNTRASAGSLQYLPKNFLFVSVDDNTGSRRQHQDDHSPSTSQRPGTSLNAMGDSDSDSDLDSSLPTCIFTPPSGLVKLCSVVV